MTAPTEGLRPTSPPARTFVPALVVGGAMIGVGVWGVLGNVHHFGGTVPVEAFVRWTVGLALLNDLVVAPIASALGATARRFCPPTLVAPLRAGLLVSTFATVMFWPSIRGWGRLANTPSILPLDYAAGLAWVLVVTWATVLVWAVLARRRSTPGA